MQLSNKLTVQAVLAAGLVTMSAGALSLGFEAVSPYSPKQ